MDILKEPQSLIYLISLFLVIVFVLPFVFKEIKKKKEAQRLVNRIIPVSSLSDQHLAKIQTFHPEGRKMHPVINTSVCVGCSTCVMSCKAKDTLYLVNGKSTLVNPLNCKAMGECERQCPTGALQLVEYGERMKIKVPQTGGHFESNVPGIYIVGALTGAGLIKEAINQGRAAVNHIMRDVFPGNLPGVLVVGAGPAGLSALLSCRKFGLPVVCLEKERTANTIRNFPKKKILMAEPVEMPIFGPLWVGDTTREELLEVWDRILEKTGAQITTGARLEQIERKDGQFIVTASGERYRCDKIILALGNRGVPRRLNVPGEEGGNVFYNLMDSREFAGSAVTIAGAGDSAVEAALTLRQRECRVNIVVRGDGFPRVKAKNRDKILTAIDEKRITAYFRSAITHITADSVTISSAVGNDTTTGGNTSKRIHNDHVFVMAGGELPFQLLEKFGIDIIEKEV
ncbi:MAG: NAD(P)-binding domain-containing protein [bacterium]|nr:NAD(P)-binding domain-containing protein [bacterium]